MDNMHATNARVLHRFGLVSRPILALLVAIFMLFSAGILVAMPSAEEQEPAGEPVPATESEPATERSEPADGDQDEAAEAQLPERVRTITLGTLRGPTALALAPMIDGNPEISTRTADELIEAEMAYAIEGSPQVLVSRLISGEVDIATLPSNVGATLSSRGVPVRIGPTFLWGLLYLLGPEGELSTWEDLEGRTVYSIGRNTTPDLLLRYFLSEADLSPQEDVTIDYSFGHVELAQALIAGRAELAVMPEPLVTQVLLNNQDLGVLIDLQAEWEVAQGDEGYPQTVFLVREELASEDPELLDAVFAQIRSTIQATLDQPDESARLAEELGLGFSRAAALRAIDRLNLRYIGVEQARDALNRYFQVLFELAPDSVGGSVPGDEAYLP